MTSEPHQETTKKGMLNLGINMAKEKEQNYVIAKYKCATCENKMYHHGTEGHCLSCWYAKHRPAVLENEEPDVKKSFFS